MRFLKLVNTTIILSSSSQVVTKSTQPRISDNCMEIRIHVLEELNNWVSQ